MSFYKDFLKDKKEDAESPKKGVEREDSPPTEVDSPDRQEELEREDFLRKMYGKGAVPEIKSRNDKKPPVEKANSAIPPMPQAPAKGTKILARILITFLLIAVFSSLAALVWYWAIKTPRVVTETIVNEVEIEIEIPEIPAPLSFFNYDHFLNPIITRSNEIPTYMGQYLKEDYDEGALIKVSFKDQRNRANPEFITLRPFFESLGIRPPSGFYDQTKQENLNVFIYSGTQNDMGIAFPVEEGGMTELLGIVLATWDERIERDFSSFYSLTEESETQAPPSTIHSRVNIRCRNTQTNHQLCYAPYDNRIFLITTSLESAIAAIDKIIR